jgi:phage recombination protein Bet
MTELSDLEIRAMTSPDLSDGECELVRSMSRRTGLSPLVGQLHAMRRDGRLVFVVGIHGLRLIAEDSGEYRGQTPEAWCGEDGTWRSPWVGPGDPVAARVGVYRHGFAEPLYAIAYLDECIQRKRDGGPTRAWATRKKSMLAKCAESLALRKAFPGLLSGVYSQEELDPQAEEHAPPKPSDELKAIRAQVKEYVERYGAEWCKASVRHDGRASLDDWRTVLVQLRAAEEIEGSQVLPDPPEGEVIEEGDLHG